MRTALRTIGSVGVDSGQIIITDPCYVYEDDFVGTDEPPTGGKYDAACRITLQGDLYGQSQDGFVSATAYGDGCYPVYGEFDGDRLVRITIDFDPDGSIDLDDDDEWED